MTPSVREMLALFGRASSSSSSDDFDGWDDDEDEEEEGDDDTDEEGDGNVYDWTVMDTGGEQNGSNKENATNKDVHVQLNKYRAI